MLPDRGPCPFCGAVLDRSVHECVEVFEMGFGNLDHGSRAGYRLLFLMADAHALQHPELHGRWSNHFHLARLVAIFDRGITWRYEDSRKLSAVLDRHADRWPDEHLSTPARADRGSVTMADVRAAGNDPDRRTAAIEAWARSVHAAWSHEHNRVAPIVDRFIAIRS